MEGVRECGAAVVLDHDDAGLSVALRASAPEGVDVWWDNSGHGELGMPLGQLALGAGSSSWPG
jgi:NADPH-dependent curcumin reductase CurA